MAEFSSSKNWLGWQDGSPFIKYDRMDDVPAEFKSFVKPHTPAKGKNAGTTHYRLWMTAMNVQVVGISERIKGKVVDNIPFPDQYAVTVVDMSDGKEWTMGMPCENLSTLTILFSLLQAPTHCRIEFGRYPRVFAESEAIKPSCAPMIYEDGGWAKNPDFDKAIGAIWYKACDATYSGADVKTAKEECLVAPNERKVICKNDEANRYPKTRKFYEKFSELLAEYFDEKLKSFMPEPAKQPAASDNDSNSTPDDDLPF